MTIADPAKGRTIPGEAAIWVFIFGDMMMFSMFFGQFIYDRAHQLSLFVESQRSLGIGYGAINTIVLLTGSLFVVLGVDAVKKKPEQPHYTLSRLTLVDTPGASSKWPMDGNGATGTACFALTAICAFIFAVDKVLEYAGHLRSGITPATNAFYTYYYLFTGIHALHLTISMVFLGKMLQISRKTVQSEVDLRFIESGASFWHLVDLLWIALFAVLYLLP